MMKSCVHPHRGWTAWVPQTNFSLLHHLNLEGGFWRCWLSNQQAFTNICAINHTEEYSPQAPLAAVLKAAFVRLNLPSEPTRATPWRSLSLH